jgi:hypothetical protein
MICIVNRKLQERAAVVFYLAYTERRGRVVGTPASHSRGLRFKYRYGDRLPD